MGPGTIPDAGGASPATVRVDLGRASRTALLVSVPLFTLFVAGFVHVALGAADRATAVIGWVFATLFSLPLLVVALSIKRLLMPRSIELDAAGFHGKEQAPPVPELSPWRWRLPLPPAPGLSGAIARGMETFQPSRWLGWFARPWRVV